MFSRRRGFQEACLYFFVILQRWYLADNGDVVVVHCLWVVRVGAVPNGHGRRGGARGKDDNNNDGAHRTSPPSSVSERKRGSAVRRRRRSSRRRTRGWEGREVGGKTNDALRAPWQRNDREQRRRSRRRRRRFVAQDPATTTLRCPRTRCRRSFDRRVASKWWDVGECVPAAMLSRWSRATRFERVQRKKRVDQRSRTTRDRETYVVALRMLYKPQRRRFAEMNAGVHLSLR